MWVFVTGEIPGLHHTWCRSVAEVAQSVPLSCSCAAGDLLECCLYALRVAKEGSTCGIRTQHPCLSGTVPYRLGYRGSHTLMPCHSYYMRHQNDVNAGILPGQQPIRAALSCQFLASCALVRIIITELCCCLVIAIGALSIAMVT